jgi:hypothetical protein
MALFSNLLSASSDSSGYSSSSIPTLLQLFTSKPIAFDDSAVVDEHAVLSYQALEVSPPVAEGESNLFQQRRSKNRPNQIIRPNLGVWNCFISKEALIDSLLQIPDAASGHYCLTIDLSDPSLVEPSMALMQETLVRLLIQQTSNASDNSAATTSLSQLKSVQFGLAKEDKTPPVQVAETDDMSKISLIICAIMDPLPNKDDYKDTQAQNLIIYHLRRFAASLNCWLCFVGKTEMEIPTIPLNHIAYSWREWISHKKIDAIFAPNHHQPDLIESVLLRNAHMSGEWDAATDSLWKALPPSEAPGRQFLARSKTLKSRAAEGDEGWMLQLRESVVVVEPATTPASTVSSSATPTSASNAKIKTEDAAVSSFFENLLKK